MSSGGYVANNFRQGYRAEYLAQYVISEFGPCERIHSENDYGVDLIATIMGKVGIGGYASFLYGIQVKSADAPFYYEEKHIMDWIGAFNIPLFMCRANRDEGRVKIYSTWTIHHLVLNYTREDIEKIDFIEDYGTDEKLKMPEVVNKKAMVWLGKPIIDVSVAELKQANDVEEMTKTLAGWVSLDADNYFRRNAGIPVLYGFLSWEVNRSLESSQRVYYKPYFYNTNNTDKAIKLIQECATLIALNKGKNSQIAKDLAEIVRKYGISVQDFTKSTLGI